MIPGVTPGATYPLSTLPAEYDESVPNPLRELLALSQVDRQYLLIARPKDPATGNEVTVRISSAGYASMPGDVDGVVHFPVGLVSPYNVRVSLVSGGRFTGSVAIPAFGDITIANPKDASGSGRFDSILGYSWEGAPIEIYLGRKRYMGPEFSTFGRIFRGRAASISHDFDAISISIRDLAKAFDRKVTTRTYRGFTAAVRFDSTDSISLGSPASLNSLNSLTFEFWIRLAALPPANRFICGWVGSAPYPYRFLVTPTGALQMHRNGGSFTAGETTTTLSAGKLYHVAYSFNDTALSVHIYDDATGETTTESFTLTSFSGPTSAATLTFGGGTGPVNADFWEYRFWSSALTADQIAARRDRRLEGTEAGLLAYYPADTGTGSTLFDEGPSGINGTISGTTWVGSLEGGPELAGRSRPRVWGMRRQLPAHLVDAQRLVYQVNDGPTESIEPFEQGLSGVWTYDGDSADIYGTTPAAGHYSTDLSRGLFRLGSSSGKTITADVEGDNVGGYVETTADIIERIVTTEGALTGDDYDLGSFSALNTANASVAGAYSGLEAAKLSDLLTELMAGVGGWWAFSREGVLELGIRSLPSVADVRLTRREIREGSLRRSTSVAPVTRVTMSYRPYAVTQRPDNLNTSLTDAQKADLGKAVRLVQTHLVPSDSPDSEPVERETQFDDEKAAQIEADRQFAMDVQRQEVWEVHLTEGLFQYWIGTPVEVIADRFDLSDPDAPVWLVVGLTEDAATDQISITLWGVK
jgi:hypothetical protein